MKDRLRARIGVWMLHRAEQLLRADEPVDTDPAYWDTCSDCGATGCDDGTADHAPDCSVVTGLRKVTLRDMWPHGPAQCEGCGATLWPGETEAHIPDGDIGGIPIVEVACVGCAAHAAVSP